MATARGSSPPIGGMPPDSSSDLTGTVGLVAEATRRAGKALAADPDVADFTGSVPRVDDVAQRYGLTEPDCSPPPLTPPTQDAT